MTETPTIYPALVRVVCDGPPSAFVRVVDRDELRRHVRGLLADDRLLDDRLVVFLDAIVGVLERDGRWCDGDAGASIELLRGPYPARVRSWIGTDADPEEVVVDREGLVAKVRDVFFFGVDQVISDGPAHAIVDGIEERLTVYGGRVAIDTTRDRAVVVLRRHVARPVAGEDRLVAHFGIDRIPGETDAGLRRRVAVDRRFVRPTDAVQPYPLDEVTISWTHR